MNEELDKTLDRLNLFLCSYVVALAGRVQQFAYPGEPLGPSKLFCYSAFVIDHHDQWYLCTAGHIFQQLDDFVSCGATLHGMCIGTLNQEPVQVPFDVMKAPRTHIYTFHNQSPGTFCFGLDVAACKLPLEVRQSLTNAGIRPAVVDPAIKIRSYTGFLTCGLPSELMIEEHSENGDSVLLPNPTIVSVRPTWKYRKHRLKDWFIGRFGNKMPFKPYGLSGGLIFGFRFGPKRRDDAFEAVAVQCQWFHETGLIFGCPISEFQKCADKALSDTGEARTAIHTPL